MLQLKLGTTNENYDRWLCGFTPYYTAVCWFGFDMNESINFNNKNPAGLIWSSVMKQIHSGLPNTKFEMSDGVVTRTICRDSGKIANSNCPNTFTEYFLKGTIPDACTQHSSSNLNNNQKSNTNKNTINSTTKKNTISTPTTQNDNTQEESNNVQNTTVNTDIQNNTNNTTNSIIDNTNSNTSNNTISNTSNVQNTTTNAVNNINTNSSSNFSNNVETNNITSNNELSN